MLFNSPEFIFFFLPFVWLTWYFSRYIGHKLSVLVLLLASVVFYGWWNIDLLWCLIASICANYVFGQLIKKYKGRPLLLLGVSLNLISLGYFKYANFFIDIVVEMGGDFGHVDVILPLGISFFTFQQIAYLVDAYRGEAIDASFDKYALFVSFFPQLIAGPIVHQRQLLMQLNKPSSPDRLVRNLALGLVIFGIGLFKKVAIADQIALFASPSFDAVAAGAEVGSAQAWLSALSYTFQIYFDFSGYSDMAVGLACMFGFKLPENFNAPYRATSIIDFWRRWHMTLSYFLRDYLYIPLGGGRCGPLRRHANLLTVMLLGGLWHGAGWNFILWGGLHGVYLLGNHAWRSVPKRRFMPESLASVVGCGLTFSLVVIAWVPFRAANPEVTFSFYAAMFDFDSLFSSIRLALSDGEAEPETMWLCFAALVVFFTPTRQRLVAFLKQTFLSSASAILARADGAAGALKLGRLVFIASFSGCCIFLGYLVSLSVIYRPTEFLYFQF